MKLNKYNINHKSYVVDEKGKVITSYKSFTKKRKLNDIFEDTILPIILSIILIINISFLAKSFGFSATNGYLCLILMYVLCMLVR